MIAFEGTHVYPAHGAPTLREIGIGLGRQPRFAGQTRKWYPVLAHSIVAALLLPAEWRVYGLLHDAHEAVLGDTVTTWKSPERHAQEDLLQARIYERLGLPWPGPDATVALKAADLACLAAEAHVLGHPEAEAHWPLADVKLETWMRVHDQLDECRDYLDADKAAAKMERAFAACIAARNAARLVPA